MTTVRDGEEGHRTPSFLPGGRTVLFSIWTGDRETSQVAVYDFDTGERHTLLQGVSPRFVATGHLVFWRNDALWAVPFDPDRMQVDDRPAAVVQDVQADTFGTARYAVSADGLLAYVRGSSEGVVQRSLVWVDRNGREEPIGMTPRAYTGLALSPDGARVVVDTLDGEGELFLYDLNTRVEERFTFDPGIDANPLWSFDSASILFTSSRSGSRGDIYIKAADGSGAATRLTSSPFIHGPYDWADDGETLIFVEAGEGNADLLTLRKGVEAKIQPLLDTDAFESLAKLSPNERWMAYRSDESGEPQIYVRPYPNPKTGAQRLISDKRGEDPLWGSDGRELFYLTTEAAMAVPVDTGDTFQRGTPQRMFSMDPYYEGRGFSWDIHPDDRRFLLVKREQTDAAGSSQIVLVQNWHEELKRLVPID